MSSGKTQFYSLNQWEPGDDFTHTEFNADNVLIDAALERVRKGTPIITRGEYRGDNTKGRHISLGRTIDMLILVTYKNVAADPDNPDHDSGGIFFHDWDTKNVQIHNDGFDVTHPDDQGNCSPNSSTMGLYHFIAITMGG